MNIVEVFEEAALKSSKKIALIDGSYKLSFGQLKSEVDRQANSLNNLGFEAGSTCLVLLRNSAHFVASVFALFKIGVVPILIDPGMGLKRFLKVVGETKPQALLGIPRAFALSKLAPESFSTISKKACWGYFPNTVDLRRTNPSHSVKTIENKAKETAAILFTSGSTGPAKGVLYTHEIFCHQVDWLKEVYQFQNDDIDLPGFPLFGLFTSSMGVTSIIPELDPSKPARCNPAKLVKQIHRFGVTSLQGSPAIWKKIANFCLERNLSLKTITRLVTFGAPIHFEFIKAWQKIAPRAKIYTPYGATEALPITNIEAEEILTTQTARNHQAAGLCVGKPLSLNQVRVIELKGDLSPQDELLKPLARREVGEIAVCGPIVTEGYYNNPAATKASKIQSPLGVWHLMGDMGYFDEEGRLWLVGRKSHIIDASTQKAARLYPLPAEALVIAHPEVEKVALVEGSKQPILIVEKKSSSRTLNNILERECLALLHQVPQYHNVIRVLFHPALPVDPRHNAKIHREELSTWAKKKGL